MDIAEGLKKLGQVIATASPLLGSVVAGPGGAAIGALIAQQFGATDDPWDILQKMQADPNMVVKLKELEINSTIELQRIYLEQQRIELQNQQENARIAYEDRQGARNYAVAVKSPTTEKVDNFIKIFLTVSEVVLVFGCLAAIIFQTVDKEELAIFGLILGIAIRSWTTKGDYYWGAAAEKWVKENVFKLNQNELIKRENPNASVHN